MAGVNAGCDALHVKEVPTGSSDFQMVLHQLHIHDSWRGAAGKAIGKDGTSLGMEGKKNGKKKEETVKEDKVADKKSKQPDKKTEVKRSNSFSKLKRFLNIKPQSDNQKHKLRDDTSPSGFSFPCITLQGPGPKSPSFSRVQLEVDDDSGFRGRAFSDSSAMKPHRRKVKLAEAESTSPIDHLHVHWPDEHQGEHLATYLRPRSYSHGSGERPTKPILKKSPSKTVYY